MRARERWDRLRPADRRALLAALVAVGLGTALTLIGSSPAHTLMLTALGIAGVLLWHRTGYAGDTVWPRLPAVRRDGNRRDVSDLGWSVLGRDGRVTATAARRVRHLTERRLAHHGIDDLADPDAATDVAGLLGPRAARTVHDLVTDGRLPTPTELDTWLTAFDRLDQTPTTPDRPDGGTPR
ncbi:hypothetical protein [Cellulosimicrobium protaetiae]|uniref:Uncharacterized protein n=1 Tax=Cellulosimicrobium protaetiae TaxID=2587808 RepID=A0A6M5UFG9_9MICO|nr:hypothetical protein [Cellulosimicrobium protaetiae]QJW36794.1 hypothetical protein FIC82_011925 [Cellulosimicrobium protaetiae]